MHNRIIQIVQHMAPGGIESLARDLVLHLPGDNLLYSLEGETDDLLRSWSGIGAAADRLNGFGKRAGIVPRLVFRLAEELRRVKPTAVFTHHVGPLLYGGLAARLARVPVVVHVEHDVWHLQNTRRRSLVAGALHLVKPRVAAVSAAAAEALGRAARIGAVHVPNGIDLTRFRPGDRAAARKAIGVPAAGPLVGCVGRLETVKGMDRAVEALRLMRPETRLAVVGEGSQRGELARLAAERGVADRVHFLGLRSDLPRIYPAFDVFCLPSRAEGLPLAVLEAQACDVPVAAFDVGAIGEAVCPATGLVVPENDVRAMAEALSSLLIAPPLRAPRRHVEDRYDARIMFRRYEELSHAAFH